MVGLAIHLETFLGAGGEDGAQGIALAEQGQEALHRHGLAPEVEVGHQLIATVVRVEQKADVTPLGGGEHHITGEGLAAVAANGPRACGRGVAEVGQGLEEGTAIEFEIKRLPEMDRAGAVLYVRPRYEPHPEFDLPDDDEEVGDEEPAQPPAEEAQL